MCLAHQGDGGIGRASLESHRRGYPTNGQTASLTDGNNNPANFGYDGFDRLSTTTFPDGSYEQLGYDGTGQLWSQRRRDGTNVPPGHDNLFRVTSRTLPNKGVIQRDYTSDDVSRPRHFFVTVARG